MAEFLEGSTMNFRRGMNEKCVYYHKQLDLVVIVYVDDLLVDGDEAAVKDFFEKLNARFQCGEPEWLLAACLAPGEWNDRTRTQLTT